MTDLTHGIINLNGYDIGPETTLHEMFEAFLKAKRIGNGKEYLLLTQMGLLQNENGVFVGRFSFRNEVLLDWELSPACVEYPKGNDSAMERRIQREFCESWLKSHLGEPDIRIDNESIYYQDWGTVSVSTPKDPQNGSEISASYKRAH